MKIDKKYIVIAVCILIGGVLTATLAFIGPDIITNGTINPNNVVTGNLKLKITDTSVNINNMAPIRSSNYETEGFKKEFTISNAESTLNGCMKIYLNVNSISDSLKSEYFVYKIVSEDKTISGNFKNANNGENLLLLDGEFLEAGASKKYTIYIWIRYIEDENLNLINMLNTSFSGNISVNGSDTKMSSSCTSSVTNSLTYRVRFMDTSNKTISIKNVLAGSTLGNISAINDDINSKLKATSGSMADEEVSDNDKFLIGWYTETSGTVNMYDEASVINDDIVLKPSVVDRNTLTLTCTRKASVDENETSDIISITSTGDIASYYVNTTKTSAYTSQTELTGNKNDGDGGNTTEYIVYYKTVIPKITYYIVTVNSKNIASKVGTVTCSGRGSESKE